MEFYGLGDLLDEGKILTFRRGRPSSLKFCFSSTRLSECATCSRVSWHLSGADQPLGKKNNGTLERTPLSREISAWASENSWRPSRVVTLDIPLSTVASLFTWQGSSRRLWDVFLEECCYPDDSFPESHP